MYIFLANLNVIGVKSIKAIIIAIKDCDKSKPMKTLVIIKTAIPIATVKP